MRFRGPTSRQQETLFLLVRTIREYYAKHPDKREEVVLYLSFFQGGLTSLHNRELHLELRTPLETFKVLDDLGYLALCESDTGYSVILKQSAFDYYDYTQKPKVLRLAIDLWDKTQTHWLSLLFGFLGGLMSAGAEWVIAWVRFLLGRR